MRFYQHFNAASLQSYLQKCCFYSCVNHTIIKGTVVYESPELRSATQTAVKIYCAFVKRSAYHGHQVINTAGKYYQQH